jgi:hypothetical protein
MISAAIVERLKANPTGTETVDLAAALLTFVLAMIGVNERVKAGAELVKALAKACATRMDSPQPTQFEGISAISPIPVVAAENSLAEVNVRLVLDALAVRTIEMEAADFLKLLEHSVIVDAKGGICMSNSSYATRPEKWSDVGWVQTVLTGASITEQCLEDQRTLTLHVPYATKEESGMLGDTLQAKLSRVRPRGSVSDSADCFSSTTIGSKKLMNSERLRIEMRAEYDLRPALRTCGIRLKGHRRTPGYSVSLFQQTEPVRLFSLLFVSMGAKP